jgi:hypothetical protein
VEQHRADQAAKMKARDGNAEASNLGPVMPGAELNGDEEKQERTEQADEQAADGSRQDTTITGLP